jgi:hypothetical protein
VSLKCLHSLVRLTCGPAHRSVKSPIAYVDTVSPGMPLINSVLKF